MLKINYISVATGKISFQPFQGCARVNPNHQLVTSCTCIPGSFARQVHLIAAVSTYDRRNKKFGPHLKLLKLVERPFHR